MRKNVFSFSKLILAITLVVATFSTAFVGCKSYDDDIKDLNDKIAKVAKDLADLKTQVDGIKQPVKAVSKVGDKVVIEIADGTKFEVLTTAPAIPSIEIKKINDTTYELWINNQKAGESIIIPSAPAGKDVTIVKDADGNYQMMVDGKPYGDKIVIPETKEPVLTINDATGELILNGKPTGIKVQTLPLPLTAYFIKDELTQSISLVMPDKDGKAQDPVTLSYAPSYSELSSLANIPSWLDNGTPREKFFFAPTTKVSYVGSTPKWTFRYNPSKAFLDNVSWDFLVRDVLITRASGDNPMIISINSKEVKDDNVKFNVSMLEKSFVEKNYKDYVKFFNEEHADFVIEHPTTGDDMFEYGALAALKATVVSTDKDAPSKDIVSDYVRFTYRTATPAIINSEMEAKYPTYKDLQNAGYRLGANHDKRSATAPVLPKVDNEEYISFYSAGSIVAGIPAYSGVNATKAINKANATANTIARAMAIDFKVPYKATLGATEPYKFDLNGLVSDAVKSTRMWKEGDLWYKMDDLCFHDFTYIFSEVEDGVNLADDTDKTDQQSFVSLSDKSWVTIERGTASIGREPIFNVAMVTAAGDTLATAYIKFKITAPNLDPIVKEVDGGKLKYADLYGATNVTTIGAAGQNSVLFTWDEMNKIYTQLGLSHDQFKSMYSQNQGAQRLLASVVNVKGGNKVGATPTSIDPMFKDTESNPPAAQDSIQLKVNENTGSVKSYTPVLRALPRLAFGDQEYALTFTPFEADLYPTVTIKFKFNIEAPVAPEFTSNYTDIPTSTSTTKGLVLGGTDQYKMAKAMKESYIEYLKTWNKMPYGGGTNEDGISNPASGVYIPVDKRSYYFAYGIANNNIQLQADYNGWKINKGMIKLSATLNNTYDALGAVDALTFPGFANSIGTSPYMDQYMMLEDRIDTTEVTYSSCFYRAYENSKVLYDTIKVRFVNPIVVNMKDLALETKHDATNVKLAEQVTVDFVGNIASDKINLFDGTKIKYKNDLSWDLSLTSTTPWTDAKYQARYGIYGIADGGDNCEVKTVIPMRAPVDFGTVAYSLQFGMKVGAGVQAKDLVLISDRTVAAKDGNKYPVATLVWNNEGTGLFNDIATSEAEAIFVTDFAVGRVNKSILLKKSN